MGKKGLREKFRRFRRLLAVIMCVIMATGTGASSLAELGPLNIWIPLASDSNATAASTEEEETEESTVVVASWSDATLSDATASNAINWQAQLQARIDALPSIQEIREDDTNELLIDTYWEVLDIMDILNDQIGVALYDSIMDADDGSIEGADELDVSRLYEIADYVMAAYAALESYEQVDLDALSFVTEEITVEPEELAGKNQATLTLEVTGDTDVITPDSEDKTEVHKDDYYSYYTNEQLTLSFSIDGNLTGYYDYRIYFKPSDPAGFYSSLAESEMFENYGGIETQLTFSGLIDSGTYGALETGSYTALMEYDEDLDAWYLDFTDIPNAVTVSGTLKMTYPSPNTPGGDVLIFGVIYDEKGNVVSNGTEIEAFDASWKTQREIFEVALTLDETQETNGLILQTDEGSTHVAVKDNPDQDIIYTITMTNETEDSVTDENIGEDLILYIDVTNTISLPDGITLPTTWWEENDIIIVGTTDTDKYGYESLVFSYRDEDDTVHTVLTLVNQSGNSFDADNYSLAYDSDANALILTYRILNSTADDSGFAESEIEDGIWEVRLNGDYLQLTDSTAYNDAENDHEITSDVKYVYHYTWSEERESLAEGSIPIAETSSNVVLTKTADRSDSVYMGEDASYTITLYNQGVEATTDLLELADTKLSVEQYITPKNIWKMFIENANDTAENSGEYLKIVITNALVYYSDPKELADFNTLTDITGAPDAVYESVSNYYTGEVAYSNGENATITMTKSEGENSVRVVFTYNDKDFYSTTVESADELAELFLRMGYVVTHDAQYSMYWDLDSPDRQLDGGETRNYKVYSTVKNTFQYYENLNQNYAGDINVADNTVYLSFDNTDKAEEDYADDLSASASYTSITRDFEVNKSINQIDGDTEADTEVFYRGSIVTYQLDVIHLGEGTVKDLPLVDVSEGSQLLLIPVNPQNLAALEADGWPYSEEEFTNSDNQVEYNGTTYFIATWLGTVNKILHNIWLDGTHCAATIEIDGQNYEDIGNYNIIYTITWNYHEFEGQSDTLSYCMQIINTEDEVSDAHNTVYLNGRYNTSDPYLTSALFDEIAATEIKSGSIKKRILTSEIEAEEETYAYSSALDLETGKTTVYYKLELNSKSGNDKVTFEDVLDVLPYTYGIFSWSTENVTILDSGYVNPDADSSGAGPGLHHEDKYEILDSDANGKWVDDPDEYETKNGGKPYQMISWIEPVVLPEDAQGIWIYVQLDFPSTQGTWDLYAEAVDANLKNVFSARIDDNEEPDTDAVIHSITREAKAYLQKGVYWINSPTTSSHVSSSNSREIYYNSTTDTAEDGSLVAYYIQLYNASSSWLYLEDIQDLVPDGFELVALYSGTSTYQSGSASSPSAYLTTDPVNHASCLLDEDNNDLSDSGDVTWVQAKVLAKTDKDGTLRFSVSDVSYDDTSGYYYLQKNEAISFIAEFRVGTESQTYVYAENKIAMPYVSLSDGGLSVADVSGIAGEVGSDNTAEPAQNVGGCNVISETDEREYEGFQEVTPKIGTITQWLSSDVTVHRGEIIPGIHKSLALDEDQEANGVIGTEAVNWNIEVTNYGTISMKNYQIADYVEEPYLIMGEATYYIYDKDGTALLGVRRLADVNGKDEDTFNDATKYSLFKVARSSKELYDISWNKKYGSTGITTATETDITVGVPTDISPSFVVYNPDRGRYYEATDASVAVTVSHDDVSGNDIVSIDFNGSDLEIPAGGKAVLTIQTQPLTKAPVGTYYNLATVTPTQSYDEKEVTIGEAVSATESTSAYVKSSDQVNVSGGDSTDAQKWIQSIDAPTRIARSEVENVNGVHYIELTGTDESFTYTLEVTNTLSKLMTDLVIVDVLPQTGDYPPFAVENEITQRGSEFQVDLLTDDIGWQVIKGTKKGDTEIAELEEAGDVSAEDTMEAGYYIYSDDSSSSDGYYSVRYSTSTSLGYGKTGSSKWDIDSVDGENNSIWTENPEGARSVRIELHNVEIKSGEAVQISFNAIISADSEDNAEPGEIGWNSFAYKYTTKSLTREENTTLWAAPRKVGVKIPGNPWLTKIIDGVDAESAAEMDDQTFRFLIHEGKQLEGFDYSGSSGTLEADLTSKLENAGKKYFTTPLTVDVSEGLTKTISLADPRKDDDTDKLTYEAGEWYTVVELSSGDSSVPGNGRFTPSNMYLDAGSGSVSGNVISFQYSNSKVVEVNAVNIPTNWWINVSKQDVDTGEALQGVVFGLYSKAKPADKVVEALEASTYSELLSMLSNAYWFTLDKEDGEETVTETWYLIDVKETDENGAIRWEDLTESVYYLKELKVSDGYYLPADPIRVDCWKTDTEEEEEDTYYSQSSNSSGTIITVTANNKIGYTLPKTGGRGTLWIQLLGLLLMSMGVSLTYITKRKILSSRRTK